MSKIMKNETFLTIVRWLCMTILLVNAGLTAKGLNPIPFDETAFTEGLAYVVAFGQTIWTAWKDSPLTKAGKAGHAYTMQVKQDGLIEEVE